MAYGAPANVEIDGAFGHLRISGLEASGTSLSPEALARLFDPLRPQDLDAQLATASVASLRIAHLTLGRTGDAHATIAVDGLEIRGLDKGRVASMRIAAASADGGRNFEPATTGVVSITGLDVAVLLRAVAGSVQDAMAPTRALCDSATIEDVRLVEASLKVGKIFGSNLRIRPLLVPPADLVGNYTPANHATEWLILAVADVLRSVDADELGLTGLWFGDRQGHAGITVDGVELKHLDRAKLESLAIRGLDTKPDLLAVRLDEALWEGLDFATAASILEQAHGRPDAKVGEADLAPSMRRNVFNRIRVTMRSLPSVLTHKPVEPFGEFRIAKIQIDRAVGPRAEERYVSTLDHLTTTLPPDSAGSRVAELRRAGLADLDVSGRFEVTWDRSAKFLEMGPASVSAAGLAQLRFDLQLAAIDPAILSSDQAVSDAATNDVQVKKVSLHIDNTSLVQKLSAVVGRELGMTPDKVRGLATSAAQTGIDAVLEGTAVAAQINTALATFFSDPRSLDIEIDTLGGLRLSDLGTLMDDPAALARRLSVRAVANDTTPAPR